MDGHTLNNEEWALKIYLSLPSFSCCNCNLYWCHFTFSDIDECATGADNCQQDCIDNDGSFTCTCMDGYMLNADNVNCDSKCMTLFSIRFFHKRQV